MGETKDDKSKGGILLRPAAGASEDLAPLLRIITRFDPWIVAVISCTYNTD